MTDNYIEKTTKKVADDFFMAMTKTKSKQEMTAYCQLMAIMCLQVIAGLEGQQFKNDFCAAAIADKEQVTVERVN